MSTDDLNEIRLDDPWWADPASLARHATRMKVPEQCLRTLLVPLALAEGQGLPVALWPPLASAVAGYDTGSELASPSGLTLLGPFVDAVQDDDGRTLMRIAHPEIARAVRDGTPDRAAVQLKLAAALLEQVPEQDWSRADPYVRDHIAGHALAAGRLNDVLTDPGLFVYADPAALLATVQAAPRGSLSAPAEVYADWGEALVRAEAGPRLRAALLETWFVVCGAPAYAEALHKLGLDLPWRTMWSVPGRGVTVRAGDLPVPGSDPQPVVRVQKGHAGAARVYALPGGELLADVDPAALRVPDEAERAAWPLAFTSGEKHVLVFRRSDGAGTALLSHADLIDPDLTQDGYLVTGMGSHVVALELRPDSW